MTTLPVLDIETFPLRGSQLIEASAGTGKTWTIAMLYLRLVLGPHDAGVEAIERPLHPREILVVTFTEAATQELKDRIRRRLGEAATVFADPARAEADWPEPLGPIARLRARYAAAHWPALAHRLQIAADAMDDAAISTLHGWCQRVLREQAFASGTPFTLTLLPDLGDVIDEAVADLWRLQIQTLPPPQAETVAGWWTSPDALGQAVRPLLAHAEHWATADPALAVTTVAEVLDAAAGDRLAALAALKTPLAQHVSQARLALEAHGLLATFGRPNDVRRWLDTLLTWAQTPSDDTLPKLNTGWSRLTRDHLHAQGGEAVPPTVATLPFWDAVAGLKAALEALPSPSGRLLRHAAVWVRRRVDRQLAERDQIGFDGLLSRLAQALDGPSGAALAARVRTRFPAALVDEFQDTDPVQLHILDRIYALSAPAAQTAPQTALILIGDPKQAIYAFRQADIHSYLQARRACAGRLWRLDTNHRSSRALVGAVNHVFGEADRLRPEGAFRFGTANENPVPFVPVLARGRTEQWCDGPEDTPPALTVALLPSPDGQRWTRGALRDALAGACADRVAGWLQAAAEGQAGFRNPDGGDWKTLRPDDIAILVNDRFEAAAVQAALQARGVASVYLSERESVYASPEAEDLERWLQACANPRDGQALRAALATASLGQTPADLEAFLRDEGRWETVLERFANYHALWQRHGVLPAVRALLHDFHVPERLLSLDGGHHRGERALTNLLHLAELLQHTTADGTGHRDPAAVLQHLRRARQRAQRGAASDGGDSATPQLRLDSERHRVQLITVHKSKGLEYPVVCYPFALHALPRSDRRSSGTAVQMLTWHDDDGWLQVTLSDEGERWALALSRAEAERWAEDVRRLYVALTRARHATWIGLAAAETLTASALGHLLGVTSLPPDTPDAALEAAVRRLQAPGVSIALERLTVDGPPVRLTAAPPDQVRPPAAWVMPPSKRARWWIASYSALLAPATDAPVADDAPAEPRDAPASARDDQLTEDVTVAAVPRSAVDGDGRAAPATPDVPWHRLPAGAHTGTALHALLEACARIGFARAAADPGWLQAQAHAALARHGWPPDRLERDGPDLARWAQTILTAPLALPGHGASVAALVDLRTVQPEWEFWLGTARLDSEHLDAWVRRETLPDAPRPALRSATLHGMLKGFIDLVFEHQGRYYVLDHKSNALGTDDAAYDASALRQAVLAHRYELQAVLYLVALHRLLRQRLPGYRPTDHLGGALCVFWRGVHGPVGGLHALPAPLALIERLDAALAGRTPQTTPEVAP